MISLLVFIFTLGILIIVHEFGHFIAARRIGVKVEKFSIGFGPQIFSRKRGSTEYAISVIPLGGYVKLAGDTQEESKGGRDEYLSRPVIQRAQILFAGSFFNYILGLACFWFVFFAGYPTLTTKVGDVLDGFGAKDAGILVGDTITAINGQKVGNWEEMWDALQREAKAAGKNAVIKVSFLRQGEGYTKEVRMKEKQGYDLLGQKRLASLMGVSPVMDQFVKVRYGPWRSFALGLNKTWTLTTLTYKSLWFMLQGRLSLKSLTGVVGLGPITAKAVSIGLTAVIQLIALLSVSLSIFNLLPIPALDGGHLLLLVIEKLRRKALSLKAERIVAQSGMAAIIFLAVIVTYNDILRVFGDKITRYFAK